MLVNRPSAFIFQQIILPYLATTSRVQHPQPTNQQRHFSSSSTITRPYETTQSSTQRANTWQPYPPSSVGSSSRRRTREYLGYQPNHAGVDGVEEERLESYKRTTALALERIIQSHQPLVDRDTAGAGGSSATSVKSGKGKARARDIVSDVEGDEQTLGLGTSELVREGIENGLNGGRLDKGKGKAKESHIEVEGELGIEQIPESRKISHDSLHHPIQAPTTPSIAPSSTTTTKDHPFPPLIPQLLLARQFRLTTLHILNLPLYALDQPLIDRVAAYMDRHGGGKSARRLRKGPTPSAHQRSLLSDPDVEGRLPDNYSTLLKTSRPPPMTVNDLEGHMPGIELTPTQKFTAFCNLQLAHSLSPPKGMIPPKSFSRPNSSLKQLRTLLSRINKLEKHRGFIPDRVTANLILSCLLRCSLQPQQQGLRIVNSKSGWKVSPRHTSSAQGQFGSSEMRSVFETVSKLLDRSVLSEDAGLSYSRHIRPFAKMLSKGFGELGDGKGLEMVRKWDKQVRAVLEERRKEGGEK